MNVTARSFGHFEDGNTKYELGGVAKQANDLASIDLVQTSAPSLAHDSLRMMRCQIKTSFEEATTYTHLWF